MLRENWIDRSDQLAIQLLIIRSEFINALKTLKKCATPQAGEEAVLAFQDNALEITVTGIKAAFAAEGEWPGEARVDAKMLLELRRAFPSGDPVVLKVVDDRLVINSFSMSCNWQEVGWRLPLLPRNPTLRELLCLQYDAFPHEIAASGLEETIRQAVAKRDDLISRAAEILFPLGVTQQDLLPIVERCIVRENTTQ